METQGKAAALNAGLMRAGIQLSTHERRKGMKGRAPVFGADLLHSLRFWRIARGHGGSAELQYRLHRAAIKQAGCKGFDKGFSYHVAREAELAAARAGARMLEALDGYLESTHRAFMAGLGVAA